MRLARINQLRTQEVVSPPLKYRDLFEVALNVKRDGINSKKTEGLHFTYITVINFTLQMIGIFVT